MAADQKRIRRILIVLLILISLGCAGSVLGQKLPNRIPQAAPYNIDEAQFYPPPFEPEWTQANAPSVCDGCHEDIFGEWNGSMMANSWRDPGWRAAFLLIARLTSSDGDCDIPTPPDGTTKASINPFADPGVCTSTYNIGTTTHTTSGSGSLLDHFCSRCHMPANYVDNIPLANVGPDTPSGLEHGQVDPNFDPTSDNGTGFAFATLLSQVRNTEPGKWGIFCTICHTMGETRHTPYHNYSKSGTDYYPALGTDTRDALLPPSEVDMLSVADPASGNLGFGIGAGAYRISPHAIGQPERFGPLTWNDYTTMLDPYVSDVFDITFNFQQGEFSGKHDGFGHRFFDRAEMCATCHDVTNPLTLKNPLGLWAGGFPIERTYSEWGGSRYADRPGNTFYDPAFKRDCQTCHMQQTYGKPGTAQTLYKADGSPADPLSSNPCRSGPVRPVYYSHHFIGGNTYVTNLIGSDLSGGDAAPYPELSTYSFSSADPTSPYHNAYWENVTDTGEPTQHARLAWDRLRNALEINLSGPASAADGSSVPLQLSVANTGCGHKFPTGFPEGRISWVAVRAYDLATGNELQISDNVWSRTSLGVGYLTTTSMVDPNYPGCNWSIPAGSPDPYSHQFKAVASLGDGCPTLALPYATPLNLVVDANGLPIDSGGTPIDRNNPLGLPQFTDDDQDGDLYDDSFLVDTRLRPQPHSGGTVDLGGRYSVEIPAGTQGPVAVTAAVYYQSFEAVVGEKFLGNLADTDLDHHLEPCVLGGSCDGRTPSGEPGVVEGAPPVPMTVASWVISVTGAPADVTPPTATTYPANGAVDTYFDTVPKAFFSEPVTGVDATTVTMTGNKGAPVPVSVAQVGDGTWAIFPDQVFLDNRTQYTVTIAAGVCDYYNNCTTAPITWTFETARRATDAVGDTTIPLGF